MTLPQDDPSFRLLTERTASNTYLPISDLGGTYLRQDTAAATYAPTSSVGALVTAALAADPAPADAAAAAVNTALSAANQSFTLVWGAKKTAGPAGTTRGTPVYDTPAKFGAAALAPGGVITASSVCPEPIGTSITVEAWVNRATPPTGNVAALAMSDKLWAGAQATTGFAAIRFSGDSASQVTSSTNICDGAWHHIAFEMSRVNGVTIPKGFWVDGQPVPTTAPTVAATWATGITLGGLTTATTADWGGRIDELRASIGNRYKAGAAFTPATSEGVVEQRTLVLGHLSSSTMDVAVRSYPARPVGVPGGTVRYFGPFQPTDWVTDDKWEVML